MIISASRRTDIPAFYSEWFFNRIKEGFVDVRNPMNPHQLSMVALSPEVIDCIVFWTKNPSPMIDRLGDINDYRYYFQYTVNPYNQEVESNVPRKNILIDTFKKLSDIIGPERVIWRYDPILITPQISTSYHINYFGELAKRLKGYTTRCVISFVDIYKKTERNTAHLQMREPVANEIRLLAYSISAVGKEYGLEIQSCSEKVDLQEYGISHGCCIDRALIEKICGYELDVKKDKNQRPECGCVSSIDIGAYNTCQHGCAYCYANFNAQSVKTQSMMHNPCSSLLVGEIGRDDKVTMRDVKSLRRRGLF